MTNGNKGFYQLYNVQQKPMSVTEFATLAMSDKCNTPTQSDYDDLERKFWTNVAFNCPIYGADISGSLYDEDQKVWNINCLGTILDQIKNEIGIRIEGCEHCVPVLWDVEVLVPLAHR